MSSVEGSPATVIVPLRLEVVVLDGTNARDVAVAVNRVLHEEWSGDGRCGGWRVGAVTVSAIPAQAETQGGLEDYDVTVVRTIKTTVPVRAKNPSSAAAQVDHVNFKLPEETSNWEDSTRGYYYIVREKGDPVVRYEGDCQEFL
jgi:hypothetical protein